MKPVLAAAIVLAALTQGARAEMSRRRTIVQEMLSLPFDRRRREEQSGPGTQRLDGRHSGTAPDYNYSDANKNSGITWNEATFKEYIKDPRAKIPNTKMIFPASRTRRKLTICGPISSSSAPTEKRSRITGQTDGMSGL